MHRFPRVRRLPSGEAARDPWLAQVQAEPGDNPPSRNPRRSTIRVRSDFASEVNAFFRSKLSVGSRAASRRSISTIVDRSSPRCFALMYEVMRLPIPPPRGVDLKVSGNGSIAMRPPPAFPQVWPWRVRIDHRNERQGTDRTG